MDSVLDICIVGLSHRTAPVAVRERYAVQPGDASACLADLLQTEGIDEVCVLSTCNRTEVLTVPAPGFDPVPVVKRSVFRNLEDDSLYVYRGVHAIIHLFRIASGLDSLVLGETEVLAQLKGAYEAARETGAAGRLLAPLLSQALNVGKRVRTETDIGLGTLSVARVGVEIASRVFGSFESCRALIVGAGETGLLVARNLADQNVATLDFANRTFERARDAAAEFGAEAHALDDLPEALKLADIVVACIDGASTVVTAEHFERRTLAVRDRPMLVVDLSMPRAVAEDVGSLDNLLLYDLDDLEPVIEKNRQNRTEATEGTAGILTAEVHKYLALRTYAAFSPAIAELKRRFDEAGEEVLDQIAGETADPNEVRLAHELTKKLLDIALDQMKAGARHARSEEGLDREYQRFLENL